MKLITPETDKRCPRGMLYLTDIDPRNMADVKVILETARHEYLRRHGFPPDPSEK